MRGVPGTGRVLPEYGQSLTPREREVTRFLSDGLTNRQIGRLLGITESTVKIHTHSIYIKLGLPNRTSLAVWYTRGMEEEALA